MSLNWNVSKVKNFETFCFKESGELTALTNVIVWAGIEIGFGEITEKNWQLIARRMNLAQRLFGAYLHDGSGKSIYVTARDIYNHIGFYSNCSTKSEAKFSKNIRERHEREFQVILEEVESENQTIREDCPATA